MFGGVGSLWGVEKLSFTHVSINPCWKNEGKEPFSETGALMSLLQLSPHLAACLFPTSWSYSAWRGDRSCNWFKILSGKTDKKVIHYPHRHTLCSPYSTHTTPPPPRSPSRLLASPRPIFGGHPLKGNSGDVVELSPLPASLHFSEAGGWG